MRKGGGGAVLAGEGIACDGRGGGGGGTLPVIDLIGDPPEGEPVRGGTEGTIREGIDGFTGETLRGGRAGDGRDGGLEARTGGGALRGGGGTVGLSLAGRAGAGLAGGAGADEGGLGGPGAVGFVDAFLVGEGALGMMGGRARLAALADCACSHKSSPKQHIPRLTDAILCSRFEFWHTPS